MQRFIVYQIDQEWLVTCGDRAHISFASRKEAEQSAFSAADALASNGHAVSVLIMPDGPDVDAHSFAMVTGHSPRSPRN